MVGIKMQIVVTAELVGDDYVQLRIQRKNASSEDYRKFAENVRAVYTVDEGTYVETVVKYGIYDDRNEVIAIA